MAIDTETLCDLGKRIVESISSQIRDLSEESPLGARLARQKDKSNLVEDQVAQSATTSIAKEFIDDPHIKNILITAYRQNKPLIGPSSAYIKAGALATTYSDIDDVAHRLSEMLLTGLKKHVWPEADYNPYFKVRYNQQVGRSLNLLLPDAESLASQLTKDEREH